MIYNQLIADGLGVVSNPTTSSGTNFNISSPAPYVTGPLVTLSAGHVVDKIEFNAFWGSYGAVQQITNISQIDSLSLYFLPLLTGGEISPNSVLSFSIPTAHISFLTSHNGYSSTSEGLVYSLITLSNLSTLVGNSTLSLSNDWNGVVAITASSDPLLVAGVSGSGLGTLYTRDDLSDSMILGAPFGPSYHSFRGSIEQTLAVPEPQLIGLLFMGLTTLSLRRRRSVCDL